MRPKQTLGLVSVADDLKKMRPLTYPLSNSCKSASLNTGKIVHLVFYHDMADLNLKLHNLCQPK